MPHFLTPGGHRRFDREQLLELVPPGTGDGDPVAFANVMEALLRHHQYDPTWSLAASKHAREVAVSTLRPLVTGSPAVRISAMEILLAARSAGLDDRAILDLYASSVMPPGDPTDLVRNL